MTPSLTVGLLPALLLALYLTLYYYPHPTSSVFIFPCPNGQTAETQKAEDRNQEPDREGGVLKAVGKDPSPGIKVPGSKFKQG